MPVTTACGFGAVFVLAVSASLAGAQPRQLRAASDRTPAEDRIEHARGAIAQRPDLVQPWTDLAMALAGRARETGDPAYYTEAGEALAKALERSPDDLAARKAEVWLLLGRHAFADALVKAKTLNARIPDDVQVYGFLVDAHAELGQYDEAEKAAQWMLDLRPGNVPGLTRAAYLREIFGDVEGAIELMEQAFNRLPPAETEERAWAMTQLAHLHLLAGRTEVAAQAAQAALDLFPRYHYALAQLAHARLAQARYADAVELFRERYAAAPHPENLFDLAEARWLAGDREAARRDFAAFEAAARAEMDGWDNANRELVRYYADHADRAADAVEVAAREAARRRDVFTLDAYALALHRSGAHREARIQMEAALKPGIRHPRMLLHAGAVELALGDQAAAEAYLRAVLAVAPRGPLGDEARRLIDAAGKQAPPR
jgi:tetratricopeptide (TPR) repeat protein